MSLVNKLAAGSGLPNFSFPTVQGAIVDLAKVSGWRLLVVYRGRHCPICKRYLKELNGLHEAYVTIGVSVYALSADPPEKAEADVLGEGWKFATGHSMSTDQMHTLGLYISEPRSSQETDRPFAEPGLFVINPEGRFQIIDISNAPFARPGLEGILNGVRMIKEKAYPIRGTFF